MTLPKDVNSIKLNLTPKNYSRNIKNRDIEGKKKSVEKQSAKGIINCYHSPLLYIKFG